MKKELLFISNSDTVTVVAESAVIDLVVNYANKYNGNVKNRNNKFPLTGAL